MEHHMKKLRFIGILAYPKICVFIMLAFIEILSKSVDKWKCKNEKAKILESQSFLERYRLLGIFFVIVICFMVIWSISWVISDIYICYQP